MVSIPSNLLYVFHGTDSQLQCNFSSFVPVIMENPFAQIVHIVKTSHNSLVFMQKTMGFDANFIILGHLKQNSENGYLPYLTKYVHIKKNSGIKLRLIKFLFSLKYHPMNSMYQTKLYYIKVPT